MLRSEISGKLYARLDRFGAGTVFVIALLTYWLTMEPGASYWDCGEYIASAYRLEPGHPPGNPFYWLAARVAITIGSPWFGPAICVNALSGLFSALTILLLYLTVSIFANRLLHIDRVGQIPVYKAVLSTGCALTGALIYTWSDTFWFSAVEAEVYAFASFLTALMLWVALKYKRGDYRWLLLLAYLTGLSVTVHLLNLLCLPAVALVVAYAHRPRMSLRMAFAVVGISLVIIGIVLFGILPGSLYLASMTELLAVNSFGLPYHSGVIIWLTATYLIILCVIAWAHRRCYRAVTLSLWSVLLILTGLGAYALVPIRASAAPPMNQGNASNIFALTSYITREQYGSHPLLYGPTPNSPRLRTMQPGNPPTYPTLYTTLGTKRYAPVLPDATLPPAGASYSAAMRAEADSLLKTKRHGYLPTGAKMELQYAPETMAFMPRIFSGAHMQGYADWADVTPQTMRRVAASYAVDSTGNPIGRWNPKTKDFTLRDTVGVPTTLQHIRYLFTYQIGYMYGRYLLWHLIGRQNDLPSQGQADAGNPITGIPLIDNAVLGPQEKLPPEIGADNPGRHVYYFLPLLLLVLGIAAQWRSRRGRHQFNVTLALFLMTGLAIVIYLNQTPAEPRERDYSFAASFYAVAIWQAFAPIAIYHIIRRLSKINTAYTSLLSVLVTLAVPVQMLCQNLPDHDRSGRTCAPDFAYNTVIHLPEQAILIVGGDNNTFPLWYTTEVTDVRPDIRAVNTAYLSTPWYLNSLRLQAYKSDPVPLTSTPAQMAYGAFKIVFTNAASTDTLQATEALRRLYSSTTDRSPVFPCRYVTVGREPHTAVIDVNTALTDGRNYITANRLNTLDIIATNAESDHPRPILFHPQATQADAVGLLDHTVPFGPALMIDPQLRQHPPQDIHTPYRAAVEAWRWGGLDRHPAPYIDPTAGRGVHTMRATLLQLAAATLDSATLYPEGSYRRKLYTSRARNLLYIMQRRLPFSAYRSVAYTVRPSFRDTLDSKPVLTDEATLHAELLMATAQADPSARHAAADSALAVRLLNKAEANRLRYRSYVRSLPPPLRRALTNQTLLLRH